MASLMTWNSIMIDNHIEIRIKTLMKHNLKISVFELPEKENPLKFGHTKIPIILSHETLSIFNLTAVVNFRKIS